MNGKVIKAEILLGRFGLQPTSHSTSPSVPWQISTREVKLADERLRHITVPAYLDFKPRNLFIHPSRLKSHDWKQVTCMHEPT